MKKMKEISESKMIQIYAQLKSHYTFKEIAIIKGLSGGITVSINKNGRRVKIEPQTLGRVRIYFGLHKIEDTSSVGNSVQTIMKFIGSV